MRTPACSMATSTGNQRQLERAVHLGQLLLVEQAAENRRELAREIGALAREIEGGLDRDVAQATAP